MTDSSERMASGFVSGVAGQSPETIETFGGSLSTAIQTRCRKRVGLMGIDPGEHAEIVARTARSAFVAESFPLHVETPLVELRGLHLLLIAADRDPLLAIAECARIKRAAPQVCTLLLGAGEGLRSAAARLEVCYSLSRSPHGKLPWDELESILLARCRASHAKSQLGPRVMIDHVARELFVDGRAHSLSGAKFDLLCYLLEHAGRAVSAQELVRQCLLLPSQASRYRGVIRELRKQLGPARDRIRAVPGYGYRLDLE